MRPFLHLWRRTLLPALCLTLAACSPDGSGSAEAAMAENRQHIDQADVTERQENDASFLVKLTSNTLLTIELGKLAQARAATPITRQYGTRLVQSKLALLQELRQLAGAKGLSIPAALSEDAQEAYHEVSQLDGAKLDQEMLALAIKTQKQDEEAMDDMRDDAYDGDIRGLAAKHLPPLREQLAATEEMADEVDAMP